MKSKEVKFMAIIAFLIYLLVASKQNEPDVSSNLSDTVTALSPLINQPQYELQENQLLYASNDSRLLVPVSAKKTKTKNHWACSMMKVLSTILVAFAAFVWIVTVAACLALCAGTCAPTGATLTVFLGQVEMLGATLFSTWELCKLKVKIKRHLEVADNKQPHSQNAIAALKKNKKFFRNEIDKLNRKKTSFTSLTDDEQTENDTHDDEVRTEVFKRAIGEIEKAESSIGDFKNLAESPISNQELERGIKRYAEMLKNNHAAKEIEGKLSKLNNNVKMSEQKKEEIEKIKQHTQETKAILKEMSLEDVSPGLKPILATMSKETNRMLKEHEHLTHYLSTNSAASTSTALACLSVLLHMFN